MPVRRLIALCLSAAACLALAMPATAPAAKKKRAKTPTVTKVSPMRLRVGSTVTIRGRNFSSRRTRNTVIFRSGTGRSAFAKPRRASSKKLVLKVPVAAGRLLGTKSARFKLRVVVRGKFSKYTSRRLSPVLVPSKVADKGPGAKSACKGADLDGDDLLPASLENAIKTDPCLKDSDGDGLTDGWEYYSAKDLNVKAVPYPGQRPYPNALDPSDALYDFDGDGLLATEEHRAWRVTGSSFVGALAGPGDLQSALGYSDGTKFSRLNEAPSVPAWRGPAFGVGAPTQAFPNTFNLNGDAAWRDDERDADRDGLSNWLESARGPRANSWWRSFWSSRRFEPAVDPWKEKSYCGFRPGVFVERPFAELDLDDGDVDGDGLLDGEDDQDNDDFSNISEMYEVLYDLDGNGNPAFCSLWGTGVVPSISLGGVTAPVNAMNPCAPNPDARSCPDYIPF